MQGCARLLVVTGSMGVGKTTVVAEASDLLGQCGIVHATVDFDGMCALENQECRRGSTSDELPSWMLRSAPLRSRTFHY